MAKVRKKFLTVLLEILIAPWEALPLSFHLKAAKFFAWILRDVVHYRRDEVMINLARSFPEKKYWDLKDIAREFYEHFATIFTETIWIGGCKGEKGRKRIHDANIVDLVNPETFNELWSTGRSLMLLSSHCGNWELAGGIFCYNHKEGVRLISDYSRLAIVYRKLSDKIMDRYMTDKRLAHLQNSGFDGYIESERALRFVLTHRDEQRLYIFPTDQYPYGFAAGHDIGIFLHQPTLAVLGSTNIACKLGMCVAYMRWREVGKGKYELELVPMSEDASKEKSEELMERYYRLLEKDIQDQPWNYLWSHRRWK